MKGIYKLGIGVAAIGLPTSIYLYRQYQLSKLVKTDFKSFAVKSFSNNTIKGSIMVNVSNTTELDVFINNINLDIYINEFNVGNVSKYLKQVITKGAVSSIILDVDIPLSNKMNIGDAAIIVADYIIDKTRVSYGIKGTVEASSSVMYGIMKVSTSIPVNHTSNF